MLYFPTLLALLVTHLFLIRVHSAPPECSKIATSARLDCFPEAGAHPERCVAKGCCWSPKDPNDIGLPMCYFPRNYPAYRIDAIRQGPRGYFADLSKASTTFGIKEFDHVQLEIRKETKSRLRLRFTVPSDPDRWEPPIRLEEPEKSPPEETDYDVELLKSPFGIKIFRNNSDRDPLLDSSGALSPSTIISDQFLQISFQLFAQQGFGPGELRSTFPQPLNRWMRTGLWARDTPPMDEANLYGVHNFFLGLTHDGSAFGIFLLNSNAQEVALTPLPAITYRVLGGVLDFFVFTGPKPADVIAQYHDLIGHPYLPPYWSLGFHLCRYGYQNLNEVSETLKRNKDAGIPIESQWFDIDYMDGYKIWSIDPVNFARLGAFVQKKLHEQYGMKSVLIIDPAINTQGGPDYAPYHTGLDLGIFINDSRTGQPILGHVWPGETVFPDFSHPNAEQWWYESARSYHSKVPFDGLWIDMNEPASFDWGSTTGCDPNNKLDNPPFIPEVLDRSLFAKTICPSALQYNSSHYDRHNLYGYDHASVTHRVLTRLFPGKRPFLMSRSTFAGSGRYTVHWTGDNLSSWADMRASIAQMIHFNMFGIPMVGADICGFRGDTTEEMCIRWSQLGAFYPFARNHNALGSLPQDPAVWSKKATTAIKDALDLRYTILPYMYSLFFRAHFYGETVVRALAFEFPEDLSTHTIHAQFMLGSCILITPVLHEGRTGVDGYVPTGDWINLSLGTREYSRGERKYFKAPLNVIPVLVRAGCILPIQASPEITSISRQKGLGLFVLLSAIDDGSHRAGQMSKAGGELFWDDGESYPLDYVHLNFTVTNRVLTIEPQAHGEKKNEPLLKFILINGLVREPSSVYLNGDPAEHSFDKSLQTLRVDCGQSTRMDRTIKIIWSFD